MKTYQAGNFKDAYDGLRKLALDPTDDPAEVGKRPDPRRSTACNASAATTRSTTSARPSSRSTRRTGACWRRPPRPITDSAALRLHRRRQVLPRQPPRRRPLRQHLRARPRPRPAADAAGPAARQGRQGQAGPRPASTSTSPTCSCNGAGYHEPWRLQYSHRPDASCPITSEGYYGYGTATAAAPRSMPGQPGLLPGAQELRGRPERRRALALDADAGRRDRPQPASTKPT